jgi:hypothetical protein
MILAFERYLPPNYSNAIYSRTFPLGLEIHQSLKISALILIFDLRPKFSHFRI